MFAATKIALKVAILAATPLMTAAPTSHETSVPTTVTFTPAGTTNAESTSISGTLELPKVLIGDKTQSPTITEYGAPDVYIVTPDGKLKPGATKRNGATQNTPVDLYPLLSSPQTKSRTYDNHSQVTFAPHDMTPSMTSIPKSYEVYLLYRSDGTLIGPNGVVPLKPALPRAVPVTPKPNVPTIALLATPKAAGGAKP